MSNPIAEKEPGPAQEPVATSTPAADGEKKQREYKDFGHDEEGPSRM
jgi:H+-transporting ATPase